MKRVVCDRAVVNASQRAKVERPINTAINPVKEKRQPAVIVLEQLDLRGKAKSKRLPWCVACRRAPR